MWSLRHSFTVIIFIFFLIGHPWCWSLVWYRHWICVHNSSRTWPECSLFINLQVRVRHIYFAFKTAFESDFVVSRSAQDLAKTFSKWQSFVSNPNLDRKFSSTLNLTPAGMVITGAISFAAVFVRSQLLTYLLLRYLLWYSCRIWYPQYWSSIWSCIFDQSRGRRRLVRFSN